MSSGSYFQRHVLPLVIILLLARITLAHEGPPFPLFEDQKVDRYVVSLWSDPDVGDALFFVIVNQQSQLPPDLQVQIGVQPASGRLPEAFYTGERQSVSGQIQFRALVHFDAEEIWRVRVRLQSSQGTAETITTVAATPPGYGRWDLLLYLLPFLAVGVLWAIAMIRKIKRRTGDKYA
ncbi:MAG TPA: hypothetical protein VLB46_14220 [Pyrinomonadaceae bacterium]|nr:hypothetical protein [Pyrinomonadaceae bacterium]